MPEISVLVPVYNREDVIGRAIESILAQTFTDFEILIINDGSADRTESIVKSYCDARIRYISWKKNRGEAAVRQALIDEARGRYCCWQDSDDVSSRFRLELQHRAMGLSGAYYLSCGYDILKVDDERPVSSPITSWTLGHSFPCCMFERAKAVRFDPAFDVACTDMDWELNMIASHGRMRNLPIQLYYLDRRCKNRITRRWKDAKFKDGYNRNMALFEKKREEWFVRISANGTERLPLLLSPQMYADVIAPLYAEIQTRTKGYKKGWGI